YLLGVRVDKQPYGRNEWRQCRADRRRLRQRYRPRTGRVKHQPDGIRTRRDRGKPVFDTSDAANLHTGTTMADRHECAWLWVAVRELAKSGSPGLEHGEKRAEQGRAIYQRGG